ncbi:MAG: metal-dependent transcriptional regulator [Ardenticatenales bacterium]|nr:metal-dependent transcriptional regulator [Ardenticatenales bacterium]
MTETITGREEDYLRAIFNLAHEQEIPVAPGELVARLGVSSAAVSRMTQRLAQAGLLRRTAYQGVSLTDAGRRHALRVLRFHRLAELFLVRELGYDWAEVGETVDGLEHAMTEELAARLEARLGYPTSCPHGDPIPAADLTLAPVRERPLTTLPVGQRAIINRVTGDRAMLGHLKEQRLVPGTSLTLLGRAAVGGLLTVERESGGAGERGSGRARERESGGAGERWSGRAVERESEVLPLSPLVAGAIFVRRPEEEE